MISVVFASRGRASQLTRAVQTLFGTAADPAQVEVLVACDPDDDETRRVQLDGLTVWTAPQRYGYRGLHLYMSALAIQARGDWLMIWDDQAEMLTPGWDTVIESSGPAVLYPQANAGFDFNIIPIWPRSWFTALGHVAPYNHIDTYLQRLGEALGLHRKIAVTMIHNRADITGIPEDDTYREGRKLLGPYGATGDLPQEQLNHDVEVIRELLGR